MRTLLIFLFVACANGQTLRSLVTGATAPTHSNTVGFWGTYRVEFRVTINPAAAQQLWGLSWASPASGCNIFQDGDTVWKLRCVHANDGAADGPSKVAVTGRSDIRVRWQRDMTGNRTYVSVWDGNCSNKASRDTPRSGADTDQTGTLGIAPSHTWGFFRAYSTLLTGDNDTCPADAPAAIGNLFDWRFESDSLTDQGPSAFVWTISGHSFANSATYNPLSVISKLTNTYRRTARAGEQFTLSGSESRSSTNGDGAPTSYIWTNTSYPAGYPARISSATVSAPNVRLPVKGTYTFSLLVSDATGSNTSTADVFAVAAESSGVIVPDNSTETMQRFNLLTGDVTRHGTSPWKWYDIAAGSTTFHLNSLHTEVPATGATALAGTWEVTVNENYRVTGTGVDCNQIANGDIVWIWWNSEGDTSVLEGRALLTVGDKQTTPSCSFLSDQYSWNRGLGSGFQWSKPSGTELAKFSYGGQSQSNNKNYYENVVGLYRHWKETGDTAVRTQAETLCRNWMKYGIDYGYTAPYPRVAGLFGMAVCATIDHPEYWDKITGFITRWGWETTPPALNTGQEDLRERAYKTWAIAGVAGGHPTPATRTTYCTYLANHTQVWIDGLVNNHWMENLFYIGSSYPAAPRAGSTTEFGLSPWRGQGVPINILHTVHDVLKDATLGCNNTTLAATLLTSLQNATQWLYDYGRSSDGGVFYNVLYESFQGEGGGSAGTGGAGTISVSVGSTTVTGVGTSFTTFFSPGNFIGLGGYDGVNAGLVAAEVDRKSIKIASIQSNTQLTLDRTYNGTVNLSGRSYNRALVATTSCGAQTLATHCEPDQFSGRNLASEAVAPPARLVPKVGSSPWTSQAEMMLGKTYGGSAGGPGSTQAAGGPNADGSTGNFADALPACTSISPPCGGFGPDTALGKSYGMTMGTGGVPVAMAGLAGGPTAVSGTVSVGFFLPSYATQARLTVTKPDGTTVQQTSATSPVTVNIDRRQGTHSLKMEYLDGVGTVVAVGPHQPVGVQ